MSCSYLALVLGFLLLPDPALASGFSLQRLVAYLSFDGVWVLIGLFWLIIMVVAILQVCLLRRETMQLRARQELTSSAGQQTVSQYRTLFESVPYGCGVSQLDGRLILVNRAFCMHLGVQLDAAIGKTLAELGLMQGDSNSTARLDDPPAPGETQTSEVIISSERGAGYAILSRKPIELDGIPAVLCTTVDISDRKRMELALRASEENFNILFESSPVPMGYAFDTDGFRGSTWNDSWHRIFGFSRQETRGKSGADLGIWVDPEQRREFIETVIRQNRSSGIDAALRCKDGSQRYFAVYGRLIGKPGHQMMVAVYLDITERKLAEKALRESEERFSKSFMLSPAAMVLVDPDSGAFLDANKQWVQLSGFSREESIGRTVFDLGIYKTPEKRKNYIDALRAGETFEQRPLEIIAKDGSALSVLWSAELLMLGGREVLLSLLFDITERERMEEESSKLQAQLTQAQKMESIGQLAGGVAHDYNNMLGVILGHAELAGMKTAVEHPASFHLQEITKAARRSSELTQQLLTFARRQTISPRLMDLGEALGDILQMLRWLIGENIELVCVARQERLTVSFDPSQLDQLLVNICVNARDAIAGTGRVTIEVERCLLDDSYRASKPYMVAGDYVLLKISDTGAGMERGVLDKIFEPFFTTKGLGHGTGLGLATVYGIVKQNNGFINVYSEPGHGTTFHVYLPYVAGEDEAREDELPVEHSTQGNGELVLLVEDEADLLAINQTMLNNLGYQVIAAGLPSEALEMAEQYRGKIRVLLTDVVMPEMNGREVERQIARSNPQIVTVFMSGYTANVISQHGVLDSNVLFLQKPFSMNDLARKIRQALLLKEQGRV